MSIAQFQNNLKIAKVNSNGFSVAIDIFNYFQAIGMNDNDVSEVIIRNFLAKNISWINEQHTLARTKFQYINNRY